MCGSSTTAFAFQQKKASCRAGGNAAEMDSTPGSFGVGDNPSKPDSTRPIEDENEQPSRRPSLVGASDLALPPKLMESGASKEPNKPLLQKRSSLRSSLLLGTRRASQKSLRWSTKLDDHSDGDEEPKSNGRSERRSSITRFGVADEPTSDDPPSAPEASERRTTKTVAAQQAPVFFMIGCQRSGSNWLRTMLSEREDLIAPHPPHVMRDFMPILEKYGDLMVQDNLKVSLRCNCLCVLVSSFSHFTHVHVRR